MPWRLIIFILIFALFLVFITFNLENKCDIYFWFHGKGLIDVPVFLTIFVSFSLGLLCALPFAIRGWKVKKEQDVINKKPANHDNKTSGSKDGVK
jgi:uncharacterized integral membrane protein